MKNKMIKITLLLLIGLFYTNNVYAEENWPQIINAGDYKLSIEGIKLKVYPIDENTKEERTKTNEDGSTTTYTTSPEIEKYLSGEATKTIDVELPEITFNPTVKNDTLNEVPGAFIGLNLNISKEKIESLLTEEYNSVTESKQYLIELVAQTKIIEVPDGVTSIEKNSIMKSLMSMFSSSETTTTINLNETTDIAMNTISIGVNSENGQKIIKYIDEDEEQMVYYLDMISLNYGDNYQIISIHNYTEEQIDTVIETLKVLSERTMDDHDIINDIIGDNINPNTNNSNTNTQEVKVVNTGSFVEKYKYIISIVVLGLGLFLVYKNTKKKKA